MTVAVLPDRPLVSSAAPPESSRPAARKIRTLIVDDQAIEREVMSRYLKAEPDIEIVGASINGRDAVEAIQRLQPDLVFLDVQMPELDGFGVVSRLNPASMPVIIFATANEEFARRAFDVEALDYLIKPCRRERLKVALDRARRQIALKHGPTPVPEPPGPLPDNKMPAGGAGRIAVKTGGRILFLRLEEISWVEAADNYIRLHVGAEVHVLRDTMTSFESRLPSPRFLRISRSTIVNVEHIKELQPLLHGEYFVVLEDGTQLTLTRNHRGKLQQLGL